MYWARNNAASTKRDEVVAADEGLWWRVRKGCYALWPVIASEETIEKFVPFVGENRRQYYDQSCSREQNCVSHQMVPSN